MEPYTFIGVMGSAAWALKAPAGPQASRSAKVPKATRPSITPRGTASITLTARAGTSVTNSDSGEQTSTLSRVACRKPTLMDLQGGCQGCGWSLTSTFHWTCGYWRRNATVSASDSFSSSTSTTSTQGRAKYGRLSGRTRRNSDSFL